VAAPLASQIEPPAAPAAPSTAVDWQRRVDEFLDAYSKGGEARDAAYRSLFAERLDRFITMNNATRGQAIAAARRFFTDKTQVEYERVSELDVTAVKTGTRDAMAHARPGAMARHAEPRRLE
jgi:hypothetical protein